MTQHWADIDNTSLLLVWGANPVENHPACAAHMNAARYGAKKAKLIVIDPRLTRTARQINPANGDFYVRIRPGTDIAFGNALLNWIFNNAATYKSGAWQNMLDWHNGKAGINATNSVASDLTKTRTFAADDGTTIRPLAADWAAASYDGGLTTPLATGYPKYADTRFLVNTTGTDYQRGTLSVATKTLANFPIVASSVSDSDTTVPTVWNKLKAHVAPYTLAVAADICGCSTDDIVSVAKALVDNSRFSSVATDFGQATSTPQDPAYKATTILYAMGQTQHTCGSQNIKNFAIIQTLLGNMGRAGGGINALRGIHNVQGSTDFGLLYDNIPGYSSNPGYKDPAETLAHYMNSLFGNRTMGTGAVAYVDPTYADASKLGLQQRGFHNMTAEWFGNGPATGTQVAQLFSLWPKGNGVQHIKSFRDMAAGITTASVVWGQNPCVSEPNQGKVRAGLRSLDTLVCVDMFLNETATCDRKSIAAGDAKDGVTYFIPACSHVEEAGSVTSSGRWLQWRERATKPFGNSKSDIELLLRFAYALDQASAFSHITTAWANAAFTGQPYYNATSAYPQLYGKYGWTPNGVPGSFEAVPGTTEIWRKSSDGPLRDQPATGSDIVAEKVYQEIARPLNQLADGTVQGGGTNVPATGGTMWIYSGSSAAVSTTAASTRGVGGWNGSTAIWNTGLETFTSPEYLLNQIPALTAPTGFTANWEVKNRAKSRNRVPGAATNGANNFPRWGWAWLYNRRVFYNNGEIAGDQSDTFVSPGLVSCLFTIDYSSTNTLADWSLVYRGYKQLNDRPSTATTPGSPHLLAGGVTLAGQFPAFTEPIESPRADLSAKWGVNTSKGASLVMSGTSVGTTTNFPLVLTTIRCVEHFQGGPITRNNSWNVEAEPVPWIEINSEDALTYGISDGDWVAVATARSNGRTDQVNLAPNAAAGWNRGFKARVQAGLQSNQRVAPGVVAIPWHWGEKGLSTGSRANDLCIDAYDANTQIPEYKACLCSISKM